MDLRPHIGDPPAMAVPGDNSRVAKLISDGLALSGKSKAEAGRALGVSHAAVSQWAGGATRPDVRRAAGIAALLGIDENELRAAILAADASMVLPRVSASAVRDQKDGVVPVPAVPIDRLGPNDIPTYGVAVGGEDAEFYMNGQITGYARRPPKIEHLRDIYTLHIVGNSMSPRFRDGDLVYVQKRTPAVGDDVVIQLKPVDDASPPRGFIKYLVRRSATVVTCGQYDPPLEIEFPTHDVLSIDRVIPWRELLG